MVSRTCPACHGEGCIEAPWRDWNAKEKADEASYKLFQDGYTYQEIATQMGMKTRQVAWDAVQRYAKRSLAAAPGKREGVA